MPGHFQKRKHPLSSTNKETEAIKEELMKERDYGS